MEKKKTLIQSLDRALDILELIRDRDDSVRASDIAEELGLGVATAHNIIRSLYQRGYLTQDDNSRYLLGPECFKLFKRAASNFEELRRVIDPPVAELAKKTGDTTFFGCEYYGSLYCVSHSVGGGQLVVQNQQRWLEQLHCTGCGKMIIAHYGIEWYERLCKRKKPQKFTEKTILTTNDMAQELELIDKQNYALSIGECYDGIAAIGIAVYDAKGGFVGSLSQSFPSFFLESGQVVPKERAALLQKYAEKISHELTS